MNDVICSTLVLYSSFGMVSDTVLANFSVVDTVLVQLLDTAYPYCLTLKALNVILEAVADLRSGRGSIGDHTTTLRYKVEED
jgi:hypothetical protein